MIDYSIIIVNYNGSKYFETLFASLSKLLTASIIYEIIVIDNNSDDKSIELLTNSFSKRFENLKVIQNDVNMGFAKANNIAATYAKGKNLIFLNNDTSVDQNFLIEIDKCMNKKDCVITCKLLFFYDFIKLPIKENQKIDLEVKINGSDYIIDNRFVKQATISSDSITCIENSEIYIPLIYGNSSSYEIQFVCNDSIKQLYLSVNDVQLEAVQLIQNAGSFLNEQNEGQDIGFAQPDGLLFNTEKEVQFACGAAFCINKELFHKIKGFDELFFMYYEDTDLSARVKKKGFPIIFCPSAIVRHIHSGSSKNNPRIRFYIFRNQLLYIIKNESYHTIHQELSRRFVNCVKYCISIFFGKWNIRKSLYINSYLSALVLLPYYLFNRLINGGGAK
ncbi:glycosyltransferase family 2 protein [Treponema zuelzerae]|uniref:Glycosyltransferase family 2 protein n=1 Tax=Teretinema zuelzerae TaxID=156 RepID=A0AAE3EIZ5_9SPIR|nr:glycosyltransferase family 2 protein [Teretinema zuelzerae]MCD1654648.1 glycosyltransferase family 2 protein [Teretinema zuelzerae]